MEGEACLSLFPQGGLAGGAAEAESLCLGEPYVLEVVCSLSCSDDGLNVLTFGV